MKTNGDILREQADNLGLPRTSIEKARQGLETAKKANADVALARLMLRHGRLTDEAREYVLREYPRG